MAKSNEKKKINNREED